MKFYASVRMDIRRIQTIKNGDEAVGNRTQGQGCQEQDGPAVQDPPNSTCCTVRAFPVKAPVIDMALQANVVKKSGFVVHL